MSGTATKAAAKRYALDTGPSSEQELPIPAAANGGTNERLSSYRYHRNQYDQLGGCCAGGLICGRRVIARFASCRGGRARYLAFPRWQDRGVPHQAPRQLQIRERIGRQSL